MAKVVIVHGYTGNPDVNWLPWLKEELQKLGHEVIVPAMPHTNEPKLGEWLPYLQEVAGEPDRGTYFVGHSLGCPTILRYLEALPEGQTIGGAVLAAGFAEPIHLTELNSFVEPKWYDEKILRAIEKITLINSDNDPHIPFEMAERMRERFNAKLVTMHNAGHINRKDGYFTLPEALKEVELLTRTS